MADSAGSGFNLLGLLRKKKETVEIDPKAPIPVYYPDEHVPSYTSQAVGNLFPTRIKFKGIYDLDGLYKFMANWLRQRRYELYENLYKAKPPELEIRMTAERKKTGFVMELITLYFHGWGEYELDVVINGKKKKMAESLANEIILASDGNMESYALQKKNEAEKQADAAR